MKVKTFHQKNIKVIKADPKPPAKTPALQPAMHSKATKRSGVKAD